MQNQGILAKNVKKKTKGAQIIHIWKARDPANTNMQKYLQNFQNVPILFQDICAKIYAKFFVKILFKAF